MILSIKIQNPSDCDSWNAIIQGFQETRNFPNCIGSIDGKHVIVDAPPQSGSIYYNYKGTFSIVLMPTCDAGYKFTTVDIGAFEKQRDGGVFSASELGSSLESGENCPAPEYLLQEYLLDNI